ncbi:MAG: UvrD-helicase domain-containing protein [Adlercreutzia equolifaciens]
MVDEFQDTDKLQVAVIAALAQPASPTCTVGDAQQSIYRFRGADVNVFFEYRDRLRSLSPRRSSPVAPQLPQPRRRLVVGGCRLRPAPGLRRRSSCIWRPPAR